MRAAVLHGKEDIRIQDVPEHPLGAGEVRVRVEAALTCGTDLKVYRRGYHARMLTPPCVFGHELAGVITEVSGAVAAETGRPWRVGDRVVAANSAPCGECFSCRHEQENLCDDLLFLNGAYASSIVIPARLAARNLIQLAEKTSFADAALTEPLACVVQGIEDLQLKPGERVLVLGGGPIGLMFVALARDLGCSVSLAGRGAGRLALASRLGASRIFDISAEPDLLRAVPPGQHDVVVEAVGRPEVWEAAVRLVRKGGRVNFFGGCPSGTTVSFDTGLIHYSNLTLLASFHHTPKTIRRALRWIESGVVHAGDFVDHRTTLGGLPDHFRAMAGGNRAVKTLVDVHG